VVRPARQLAAILSARACIESGSPRDPRVTARSRLALAFRAWRSASAMTAPTCDVLNPPKPSRARDANGQVLEAYSSQQAVQRGREVFGCLDA